MINPKELHTKLLNYPETNLLPEERQAIDMISTLLRQLFGFSLHLKFFGNFEIVLFPPRLQRVFRNVIFLFFSTNTTSIFLRTSGDLSKATILDSDHCYPAFSDPILVEIALLTLL